MNLKSILIASSFYRKKSQYSLYLTQNVLVIVTIDNGEKEVSLSISYQGE
jgi:hypothetical protein